MSGYSITGTKFIYGKTLCVHCGEECKVHIGSYHRNEDDEYYCECKGATKEKEVRDKQSELRNKVHNLEYEAKKLIKANEDKLNKKLYEIELKELNRKYNMEVK